MESLSLKLNYFKKKLKLTNQKIAKLANLPVATVERISSGRTTNPNLKTLKALSKLFNCTIDDLLILREGVKTYYLDENTAEIARKIKEDEAYKTLFDTVLKLEENNKQALIGFAQRLLTLQGR